MQLKYLLLCSNLNSRKAITLKHQSSPLSNLLSQITPGVRASNARLRSSFSRGHTNMAFSSVSTLPSHRAMIALGSNMGDRVGHIESALSEMRKRGLKIIKESRLYETKPMYYDDQGQFLNGACQIDTTLEPLELLRLLQQIEIDLDRKKLIDKGPRTIDLDILLYDSVTISHKDLQVPHKLMLEREFVLRPLADILPETLLPLKTADPEDPQQPIHHILDSLENKDASMSAVGVLSPTLPLLRVSDPTRPTLIMAIVNMTPDSFSDGGVQSTKNDEAIKNTVREFIKTGASIIDIGGQSTRPGAKLLTADQELERIIPTLKAIRDMPEATNIAISIDTFYAKVAREAAAVGADIINDISAGAIDENMLPTVAELNKSVILMHMRGTPQTMTTLTKYPEGVIEGVTHELDERIIAAQKAGIPPWRIIIDPGIGFAKNQTQNLELLAGLDTLRNPPADTRRLCQHRNLPMLVGTSRKGFIGKITDVEQANLRTWGTAATVTASIAGGADIVRVHDVAEMVQVAKMADAIYRRRR